jgi:hypothetical protein
MKPPDQDHLSQDQVIKAVIDEERLPPEARVHLSACDVCQEKKDEAEMRLRRLGRMAQSLAPQPSRGKIGVADYFRRPALPGRWGLRLAIALSMAVVMILMVARWHPSVWRSQAQHPDNIASDWLADSDNLLMNEIARMDEPAIRQQYQRLEQARVKLGTERFRFLLIIRKTVGSERFEDLMRLKKMRDPMVQRNNPLDKDQ